MNANLSPAAPAPAAEPVSSGEFYLYEDGPDPIELAVHMGRPFSYVFAFGKAAA